MHHAVCTVNLSTRPQTVFETRQRANEAEEIVRFNDFYFASIAFLLHCSRFAEQKTDRVRKNYTFFRFYNEQIVEQAYQFPCTLPEREGEWNVFNFGILFDVINWRAVCVLCEQRSDK